jgi:hypothetical protein
LPGLKFNQSSKPVIQSVLSFQLFRFQPIMPPGLGALVAAWTLSNSG